MTYEGKVFLMPTPLAWKFEYACGVPCDSFWIEVPWQKGEEEIYRKAVRFTAQEAGEMGFAFEVSEDGEGGGALPDISMEDGAGETSLFVFDAERALWYREDDLKVTAFAPWNGELYALSGDRILALGGSGEDFEGYVPWLAETGILATDQPGRKFITELTVRMSMDVGGRVRFFLRYDSMGGWVHAGTVSVTHLRSFSLPIRPRRCDHLQLRIQGTGEARIHSITRRLEEGGDPH